jgi:general secretion pathway protein L
MSHRIVGLDLGTYSVKAIRVESSLRTHQVKGFDEEPLVGPGDFAETPPEGTPVAASEETAQSPLARALMALNARGALQGDVLVVSQGLERCLVTQIELPFTQRRQIEDVLKVQVEDKFPVDTSDLVMDFLPSSTIAASGQHPVTVVATNKAVLGELLQTLAQGGADPRIVDVGPARLGSARHLLSGGTEADVVALVDIGHEFTDVCVMSGEEITAMRRLRLGGKAFTEALARHFEVSVEVAEQDKLRQAFVEPPGQERMGLDPDSAMIRDVCRDVALDLSQELLRTFHSHLAERGRPVERVWLCGGGSLLPGLGAFLGVQLGIACDAVGVAALAQDPTKSVRAVAALGLAARGLPQRVASPFNFRRGPFAFKGDFEFLRGRAVALGVGVMFVILALIFSLLAKKGAIEARRDAYAVALSISTAAVLGEALDDPGEVIQRLDSGAAGGLPAWPPSGFPAGIVKLLTILPEP